MFVKNLQKDFFQKNPQDFANLELEMDFPHFDDFICRAKVYSLRGLNLQP